MNPLVIMFLGGVLMLIGFFAVPAQSSQYVGGGFQMKEFSVPELIDFLADLAALANKETLYLAYGWWGIPISGALIMFLAVVAPNAVDKENALRLGRRAAFGSLVLNFLGFLGLVLAGSDFDSLFIPVTGFFEEPQMSAFPVMAIGSLLAYFGAASVDTRTTERQPIPTDAALPPTEPLS